jgi:WD repeat-containing protein 68
MAEERESSPKRKEIYTYTAPWTTYTLGWSRSPERKCQLAVGSYIEEYSNQFNIIELKKDDQGNGTFEKLCQFEHPYPATKVMWAPPKHNLTSSDLLATTGDYLRLWSLSDKNTTEMKGVLNNNKHAGTSSTSLSLSHANNSLTVSNVSVAIQNTALP